MLRCYQNLTSVKAHGRSPDLRGSLTAATCCLGASADKAVCLTTTPEVLVVITHRDPAQQTEGLPTPEITDRLQRTYIAVNSPIDSSTCQSNKKATTRGGFGACIFRQL